ncbi:hypothetical protein HHI36_014036 [Cryptolaemus montrouzieri]|uniref:Gamma-interferon-inducible lysosomal thiol reductase n=1 Tax=Cryptolaemus montrouzieri TaxID=559131 RepID=A0ABD2N1M2_9CUCU
MNFISVSCLLLCGVFACVHSISDNTTVRVSIYYECLCPDSINFINNQLYPNYQNLKDKITVDFVPYGKASQTKSSEGSWTFRCQHGPDECRGNKYQACALDQKRGQDNDVKLVNCIMALADPSDPDEIKDCAVNNGYNWSTITTCYESNRASELLALYGQRTLNVSPKIRFIPTIIFDGQFDQDLQNESLYNFLGATCSKIPKPTPDVCKG